jgi:hypothetical protein
MTDNTDDVIECVQIRGVTIDLADVSHELRRKYHAASAAAGRNAAAKAKLNEVGEAILAEQMPHLALKHAPAAYGTRGVIGQLQKRSR